MAVFKGTDNADVFTGTIDDDEIRGGKDDDRLSGKAGADELYGDEGNDLLFGDSGDDLLYGGEGIDKLSGGLGTDYLIGGGQRDVLTGGPGNDYFALFLDDPVLGTDFNKSEGDKYIVIPEGVALPIFDVGAKVTINDILSLGTITDDPTQFLNNQPNTIDANPLAISSISGPLIDPISVNPLIV
ncbi:hypothetical protein LC609_32685 [Nostoc sp. XA013]|nr:hypothetical protein [Nostoc sp. XA013]